MIFRSINCFEKLVHRNVKHINHNPILLVDRMEIIYQNFTNVHQIIYCFSILHGNLLLLCKRGRTKFNSNLLRFTSIDTSPESEKEISLGHKQYLLRHLTLTCIENYKTICHGYMVIRGVY